MEEEDEEFQDHHESSLDPIPEARAAQGKVKSGVMLVYSRTKANFASGQTDPQQSATPPNEVLSSDAVSENTPGLAADLPNHSGQVVGLGTLPETKLLKETDIQAEDPTNDPSRDNPPDSMTGLPYLTPDSIKASIKEVSSLPSHSVADQPSLPPATLASSVDYLALNAYTRPDTGNSPISGVESYYDIEG